MVSDLPLSLDAPDEFPILWLRRSDKGKGTMVLEGSITGAVLERQREAKFRGGVGNLSEILRAFTALELCGQWRSVRWRKCFSSEGTPLQ